MKLLNLISVLIISAILSTDAFSQGNLLVFPTRIVFEGNQKIHELNLSNNGNDTSKYIVSFTQIRMKENGEFENITEPDSGQQFANDFLRIYPRTVILAPGESQKLKLQLAKSGLLNNGEYRSHLYFKLELDIKTKALGEKEIAANLTGFSVQLKPLIGITIPVIIRVGEPTTEINITGLSYEYKDDMTHKLNLIINRTGNMSVYGDIKVEHISPQGDITQVGNVKGIAVYTPNLLRKAAIKLSSQTDVDYHSGKLHLIFTAQRENKDYGLAEAELTLK